MLLLDGNNLAMRSFHGARGQMTSQGEDTGALQLFVNALSRYVKDERPDRMVVCWDDGRSTFRTRLYPEYKVARFKEATPAEAGPPHGPLFAMIKTFLWLAGIPQWSQPNVEADDLIASAWRTHRPGEKVVILSADKDLLQLLDEDTEQIRFSSSGAPTDRWNRQRVIDELGYRPDQIPLMMALTGDTSDGIPGMRGVGPKKAFKMLQAADWDLDRAMEPYPESLAIVKTSLALVDLSRLEVVVPEVPLFEPTEVGTQAFDDLIGFCSHYALRTIRERLDTGSLWKPERPRSFETVTTDAP